VSKHGVTEFLQIFQGDSQVFFDAETDLLIVLDDHGCIVKVNPAFEQRIGYAESRVLGVPIINLMLADDLKSTSNMPRLLHYGGGLVSVSLIDYRYKVTDEGKRWYLILRQV
jgi:PAS domain S-box-containing protein